MSGWSDVAVDPLGESRRRRSLARALAIDVVGGMVEVNPAVVDVVNGERDWDEEERIKVDV